MQFGPKFGMSKKEHLQQSDIFVNAQCHLQTRDPGHFVTASTLFLFLARRILDKKLMDHAILAKIWYVKEVTSPTI